MTIDIDNQSLEQILKTAVKQEIEFLARRALRDPAVREILWCWVLQNIGEHGFKKAGVGGDAAFELIKLVTETGLRTPSGGGGGGDDGGGQAGSSGGGTVIKAGQKCLPVKPESKKEEPQKGNSNTPTVG